MNEKEKQPSQPDPTELEREIRSDRKFSLADAIGRLGGGNLLKGASPVSQKRQAELEIEQYLESQLVDAEGALLIVLLRRVRESDVLLNMGYDQPLAALAHYTERILSSEERLRRFVADVDAEWGRIYYERPHFQKQGRPPDPDDPYTFASVRSALALLVSRLGGK